MTETKTTVGAIIEKYKALLYEKEKAEDTKNLVKIPGIKARMEEYKQQEVVLVE